MSGKGRPDGLDLRRVPVNDFLEGIPGQLGLFLAQLFITDADSKLGLGREGLVLGPFDDLLGEGDGFLEVPLAALLGQGLLELVVAVLGGKRADARRCQKEDGRNQQGFSHLSLLCFMFVPKISPGSAESVMTLSRPCNIYSGIRFEESSFLTNAGGARAQDHLRVNGYHVT